MESSHNHQDNICLANKGLQTGQVPGTLQFNTMCSRPGRRSSTDRVGLTATLLQYIDFMCYRHLPSPQHSSHNHHTQRCPSCHSSKPQNPGGCSRHSCSCEGREAPVNIPQVRHRDALGAQSFCRKEVDQPLPQPGYAGLACLPRPSFAVSQLSSS